jgi:hypothetical protein
LGISSQARGVLKLDLLLWFYPFFRDARKKLPSSRHVSLKPYSVVWWRVVENKKKIAEVSFPELIELPETELEE